MVYITDEMRNYEATDEDIFIKLKSGGKARYVHGEPLKMEPHEVKLWNDFLRYIDDNNLEELPEEYTDHRRLGFKYLTGIVKDFPGTYKTI